MAAIADDGQRTEVTATFDAMDIVASKLWDVPPSATENSQGDGSGPEERQDPLCAASELRSANRKQSQKETSSRLTSTRSPTKR